MSCMALPYNLHTRLHDNDHVIAYSRDGVDKASSQKNPMCSTHIGTFVISKEVANAGKRIQSKDNCTLCGSFRPLYTQTQTSLR